MKTKAWKNIPYVRDPNVVKKQKMDRFKWKRSLPDLLQASDAKIVHLLRQDGLLFKWEGKTCPRCGKGCMSKLLAQPTTHLLKHRCNHRGCQAYLNPQHLHPLFLDARGSAATSLQHQAALLMLILNNVKYATIHRLLHVNHKAIEDMKRRLLGLRKPWVEEKEKEIVLGNAKTWVDIEADETTFDKVNVGTAAEDPQKPMQWEQWCGIVQRGRPETLILHRLMPAMSEARAPGPGAIRKTEWTPLARRHLTNRRVILHTDAAKSYRVKVDGVLHDRVVHCKKRVKGKDGKWRWKNPTYVNIVRHKDPVSQKVLRVKSGTQIIDRAWQFLKDLLIVNQNSKVGSVSLRSQIRSAQYEYWRRNQDFWVGTGELVQWLMGSFA